MKIVVVTKKKKNVISNRINLDFINLLSNFQDIEYKVVTAYQKDKVLIDPNQLYNIYKPDIVICHNHAPILNNYFTDIPCFKIMIAVDVFKIVKNNRFDFYHKNNFDLIIHRHNLSDDIKKQINIKTVWLPYSVNEEEFYPIEFNNHIKSVGFTGTYKPEFYVQRQKAIKYLEKENLLTNYGRNITIYPKLLRKHRISLSSAEMGYTFAKTFEIMLSGSILLTSNFYGIEKLFDKKCYLLYKNDCSDIIKNTKYILNNDKIAHEMITEAYLQTVDKHTHEERIIELYNILVSLYNNKEIYKRWE